MDSTLTPPDTPDTLATPDTLTTTLPTTTLPTVPTTTAWDTPPMLPLLLSRPSLVGLHCKVCVAQSATIFYTIECFIRLFELSFDARIVTANRRFPHFAYLVQGLFVRPKMDRLFVHFIPV